MKNSNLHIDIRIPSNLWPRYGNTDSNSPIPNWYATVINLEFPLSKQLIFIDRNQYYKDFIPYLHLPYKISLLINRQLRNDSQMFKDPLKLTVQGLKLLGFRISGTPKNGDGNQNLGAGFPTGNPEIARYIDMWILGVFRLETQKLLGKSKFWGRFSKRKSKF